MEDDILKSVGTSQLLSSVSAYKQFQIQQVDNINVFLLDGVVDKTNMVTEILYWNKKTASLNNPTYGTSAQELITYRSGTVTASDINADGIIEIPFRIENGEDEFVGMTEWKQFSFQKFTTVAQGICTDELVFNYPDKWKDGVAATQKGDVWSFYDISGEQPEVLFDLIVSDISQWQSHSDKYDKLKIHYGTIYGVKLGSSHSKLALSKSEIEKCIINNR